MGNSSLVESSEASGCSSSQNQQLTCIDISKPGQVNMEQLIRARKMELLEIHPVDEVEGELIYYQHKLFQDRVAKKRLTGVSLHSFAWIAIVFFVFLSNLKFVISFILHPSL